MSKTRSAVVTSQVEFGGMTDLFAQSDEAVDEEARAVLGKILPAIDAMGSLGERALVHAINQIRLALHNISPFTNEPVDCVLWVPAEAVGANDYNPNSVAPPEMKLLEHSIAEDGYTQPIVVWRNVSGYEVVDGFHRNRVGKESPAVSARVRGYLPVTVVNETRVDRSDRIAATIRHNRARGKHRVEAMSDIVIELKRRNWSDDKIGRELGMDPDEVLRLCQITGLAEAFQNQEFSEAWEVDKVGGAAPQLVFDDAVPDDFEADDGGRVFHTWDKWECYRAGFYAEHPPSGMTKDDGEEAYRAFLADPVRFAEALGVVVNEWRHSCEHYLTNERMNRIAWLGQAAVAQALGIPSICRGGYHRLDEAQRAAADAMALDFLNSWLRRSGRPAITLEAAVGRTDVDLY